MKGKVVSAILEGRPVVGTTLSFDGLPKGALAPTACADEPHQIAEILVDILLSDHVYHTVLSSQQVMLGDDFLESTERRRVKELVEAYLPLA